MSKAACDFVWQATSGICVYSCCALASLTLSEFDELLDNFVLDARERSRKVIAGDFNCWEHERPLEAFAQLDIILANEDFVNTFRKGGSSLMVYPIFVARPRKTSGWPAKALDQLTFIEMWLEQPDKAAGFTERAVHLKHRNPKAYNASMPKRC